MDFFSYVLDARFRGNETPHLAQPEGLTGLSR